MGAEGGRLVIFLHTHRAPGPGFPIPQFAIVDTKMIFSHDHGMLRSEKLTTSPPGDVSNWAVVVSE